MAEATDYGTLSGDRVLQLSPAGICPRAVCQVRVVVPFLLLISLFCGRRLVQEPCTLYSGDAAVAEIHWDTFTALLSLVASTFPSLPSIIESVLSSGRSTRQLYTFPAGLGYGAQSW
jgi:hypothetical protein